MWKNRPAELSPAALARGNRQSPHRRSSLARGHGDLTAVGSTDDGARGVPVGI
jgi:hypothetical protein